MRGAVSHPFLQGLGQLGCFLPQDGSEGPALGLRAENQAPLHSMTGREGSVSEVGATDWPSKLKPSEVELPPPCPSGQGPGLVSPDHTWDPWPMGCAHAGASLPQTWALAQNSPTFHSLAVTILIITSWSTLRYFYMFLTKWNKYCIGFLVPSLFFL